MADAREEAEAPPDWETDPRSFADILKAWHARPGWTRDRAAAELRTPATTYYGWCAGRGCASEGAMRRLMTLIDRQHRAFGPPSGPQQE